MRQTFLGDDIRLILSESPFSKAPRNLICPVLFLKESGDVIRQHWNFSPQGSTESVEDYRVALNGVVVLKLAESLVSAFICVSCVLEQ